MSNPTIPLPLAAIDRIIPFCIEKINRNQKPTLPVGYENLSEEQHEDLKDCAFFTQEAIDNQQEEEFLKSVFFRFFVKWRPPNRGLRASREHALMRMQSITAWLSMYYREREFVRPRVSWQLMLSLNPAEWEQLMAPVRQEYVQFCEA
ncbi:hypothetical protein FA15DRAFT_709539 [Coprinopsis marcescibilis]|uniref:Uncharacterized protein n=1 Tax=Coprinopsis marcescibilis TaxID=230819 RepID=A0A5C3KG46_COPMA|nr:hypothetical protein FA15DRAFT_709539 [Coprinopsis marcescibilis]